MPFLRAPIRTYLVNAIVFFQKFASFSRETLCNAIFEKADDWYIGYAEELLGANTRGKTLEEARKNLKEAVELILKSTRERSKREFAGKDVIRKELKIATLMLDIPKLYLIRVM